MENGKTPGNLYVDLSKAFNTLKQSIKDEKKIIFRVSLQNLNTISKELGLLSMNRCIVKRKLSLPAYSITTEKP